MLGLVIYLYRGDLGLEKSLWMSAEAKKECSARINELVNNIVIINSQLDGLKTAYNQEKINLSGYNEWKSQLTDTRDKNNREVTYLTQVQNCPIDTSIAQSNSDKAINDLNTARINQLMQ